MKIHIEENHFQVCHEKIRVLSHEASEQVKKYGLDNDLIMRVKKDSYFDPIIHELDTLLDPTTFVGRAPDQVFEFINNEVQPVLKKYEKMCSDYVPIGLSI